MNPHPMIAASLAKLDELLVQDFQAQGANFAERAVHAAPRLPQESAQALAELADPASRPADTADPARLAEFVFRCGRVYEQLHAFWLVEMEMENTRVDFDRVETTPLQPAQADLLARFVETRDRLFRQVADFTLKAILVILGLLVLGLLLGLV